MAKATAKTADKPATAPVDAAADAPATVKETPASFDWDAVADEMPEAQLVSYAPLTSRKDVDADTPAFIKARVHAAFEATAKAQGKPTFFTQSCPSVVAAEDFLKRAKRYATFKEMTFRGKVTGASVAYSVRVKETRERKTAAVAKP